MGSKQRGFVLPFSILVLAVLALLAYAIHTISRSHLYSIYRLSNKEKAYHIALSLSESTRLDLRRTLEFLNSSDPETFPKKEKAPKAFQKIVNWILDDQGLMIPGGGKLSLENPLMGYLKFQQKHRANLELVLTPLMDLFDSSTQGRFVVPPRQGYFVLKVVAQVEIDGVTTQVVRFVEGKYNHILPHALGKFVLYVGEKESISPNPSVDSMFGSGSSPNLIVYPGATIPVSDVKNSAAAMSLLEDQGWIYLGGPTQMTFNLARSGERAELSDAYGDSPRLYWPMIELDGSESWISEDGQTSYHFQKSTLYQELKQMPMMEVLLNRPDEEVIKTSSVRLFGTRANPSPGIVFGNVYRQYALLKGYQEDSNKKSTLFPYLDRPEFDSPIWPGGPMKEGGVKLIKWHYKELDAADPYALYEKRMTTLVRENYNAGVLELLYNGDSELVYGGRDFLVSRKVSTHGKPYRMGDAAGGSSFSLKNDLGEVLLKDYDLSSFDPSFLNTQVTMRYETEKDFLETRLKQGRMKLAGVIYVDGDLRLSESIEVASGFGGILMVDGDVTLEAAIKTAPHEPLTILSNSGTIKVVTPNLLEVGLVALSGEIELSPGAQIEGILAARRLRLSEGVSTVRYDKNLDPSTKNVSLRAYRFSLADQWGSYVF